MRPEIFVEIEKSFQYLKISKLNFPLGKPYDVVSILSNICSNEEEKKCKYFFIIFYSIDIIISVIASFFFFL